MRKLAFGVLLIALVLCAKYDFVPFEENLLPMFIDNFSRTKELNLFGNYSFWGPYEPWHRDVSLYGASDVLFVLFITNNLPTLTEAQKQQWADYINSFQDPTTGHYINVPEENTCGMEPWHASSYARAALKLLEKDPKYPMKWVYDVADLDDEDKWFDFFYPLLDMSEKNVTIWISSHELMAYHSVVLMDEKHDQYKHFFDWWFEFLEKYVDKETGFWCGLKRQWCPPKPTEDKTDAPKVVGMAGSFHMYIVYNYVGRAWKFPDKVMNWTLSVQGDDGLWDEVKHWTYCVDLDGLFNTIRSSLLAGKLHWELVEQACEKYLKTAQKVLTTTETFMPYLVYSHVLPGAVDAVAECQLHFPHLVNTKKPWRQLVDHVPYV